MIQQMIINAFAVKDKNQGVILVLNQEKPFGFNGFKNVEFPIVNVDQNTYFYLESDDGKENIRSYDFLFHEGYIQLLSSNESFFIPFSSILYVKISDKIQYHN